MSLQEDLSAKLDISTKVTSLLSGMGSASGSLGAVALPASNAQLGEAQQRAGSVDTSGIAPAVAQVTARIAPLLEALPPAKDLLGPVTATLELVESLHETDLPKEFTDLSAKLAAILEGPREGGFIGVLVQLADALASAPEGQKLSELLKRLLQNAGADLPTGSFKIPEIVTALQNTVMAVGGLMSLEGTLSEAERLTRIMATQFDAGAVAAKRDALVACLTGTPLAQFITGIDVTSPAQVQAARAAIGACSRRLEELVELVSRSGGYGEATLLYLDMPHLQEAVAHAAGLVRNADLDPLERALRSLNARIFGALTVDLSVVPTLSLDNIISTLEGRVAEIVAGIEAFDLSQFTDPLTNGIAQVSAVPNTLTAAIGQVTVDIQAALGRLRDMIAALPFQAVGNAIRQVLQPVAQALEFIGTLVDTIKAAIGTAVTAIKNTLTTTENAVDEFKHDVEALFNDAARIIADLHVDRVLAKIAENIKAVSDLLAAAEMKPYFDTAVGVIDTTTGVIEMVPFSLLPDSMEQEVVDAIRPVKTTNVDSFKSEIESLLQIGPDGKFELRPDILAAIADIQSAYDRLITEIKGLDPRKAVEQLDVEMGKVAAKIQAISPQVELAPVQQAIDRLREMVGSFDLNKALQPLSDGFDKVLAEADKYAPGALIEPLETRLNEARNQLIDVVKLREWASHLDSLAKAAKGLLDRLDPAQLQPLIREAMSEALELLERFPQFQFGGGFGTLIASLLTGTGLRVDPLAFDAVLDWLQGGSGAAELSERSRKIAEAITSTRAAVEAFDPAALSARLAPAVKAVRDAVAGLPAGEARDSLEAAVTGLDLTGSLGNLVTNRARYLASLTSAEAAAQTLSHTGLSEVDVKVTRLQTAFAPFAPLRKLMLDIFAKLGITGMDQGIGEALRRLFSVATPERITGILAPVFVALHGRLAALIDSVVNPLKKGIADLLAALDAITLTPLRESVDGVYQSARQQIASLHPTALLGDVITAFNDAKTQVTGFDPLADLTAALTELRDTIARVLGKLNASEILATPLQIYDTLVGLLGQLDLQTLLAPLLDQIDNIAKQVDEGLSETVTAFQRLQDALPDTVGSTSVTAGASVSAG